MILVGCPVRKREWILPMWREYVYCSFENAGLDSPKFIFVVGADDQESVDWEDAESIVVEEESREDVRFWEGDRYHHMVFLRNKLLSRVREIGPDLFLSLDSDILLHPEAMSSMMSVLSQDEGAWAIGGKANMDSGNYSPSYGIWCNKSQHNLGFRREPSDDIRVVDIIMAVKLMRESAYSVDYEWHHWGEDIGWSLAVARQGGTFLWDGTVTNKHVMRKEGLGEIDARCGY